MGHISNRFNYFIDRSVGPRSPYKAVERGILAKTIEQLPDFRLKNDKHGKNSHIKNASENKVQRCKSKQAYKKVYKNDEQQTYGGLYGKRPTDPSVEIV